MVKIISDSTCDLSKELIEQYEINILPLHVILGEDEYKDGMNITPDEIYRWSDEHKATPKTSAPAITDAMELCLCVCQKGPLGLGACGRYNGVAVPDFCEHP